jgi:exodeoxyribonuclease VII large subunit
MDEKTNALSVHEAVSLAARHVEAIPTLVVTGEVSGFRSPNARSGHCYFQLKDEQSSMDAIVWRGIYQSCGFKLKDGLMVQITGSFNIYKPSGKLSFVAKKIEVAGEGLLRQQVAELARKLQAEGLMDDARKRRPPRFCERVAVVTSLSGSVIDDVKRTLARRNPLVELQMVGCKVQGEGAPETIMRALSVAAQASPDAIAECKNLLRLVSGTNDPFNPVFHDTSVLIANQRISEAGQEGMKAFFEKRKPNWE